MRPVLEGLHHRHGAPVEAREVGRSAPERAEGRLIGAPLGAVPVEERVGVLAERRPGGAVGLVDVASEAERQRELTDPGRKREIQLPGQHDVPVPRVAVVRAQRAVVLQVPIAVALGRPRSRPWRRARDGGHEGLGEGALPGEQPSPRRASVLAIALSPSGVFPALGL